MFDRWLDRDDITTEDLADMTAEEEVLDWMVGSPVPAPQRPEWLADGEPWSPAPTLPPPPVRGKRPVSAWALVLGGFALGVFATVAVGGSLAAVVAGLLTR